MTDLNLGGLSYSLRRFYVDQFHSKAVKEIKPGSHILDLGGNRVQKRGRFNIDDYGMRVVYVNLSKIKQPHVLADGATLPFKCSSFDVVICSEVLEHVAFPEQVVSEVYRMLRPGGQALICVPFLYHLHGDPYDYGRYTDRFWRDRLSVAGYESIDIEWQGYFWSVVVDMLRALVSMNAQNGIPRSSILRRILSGAVVYGKRLAVNWDAQAQISGNQVARRFTTGFGITARK